MTQVSGGTRAFEWVGYYDRFSYFSSDTVRDGCYPRIMEHSEKTEKAIVLVHGLSDSPYFMSAIGEHFFGLGYNVYLPLLHCHGLKQPHGMEGVELEEWKGNVSYAIRWAASKSEQISIGGLSTGGALSFFMAATNPKVNSTLYLFSAALDLAGGFKGLRGEIQERLLRTFLVDLLDNQKPLIGDNPYRYSHVDIDGAKELARLIKETDTILDGYSRKEPFTRRVFAAHSECDTRADIAGIEKLQSVCFLENFELFKIPVSYNVPHASLVLKDPISKHDKVLEEENPQFKQMMDAITAFG